jgi:vanillate O-demethylase ferredoxin subunit
MKGRLEWRRGIVAAADEIAEDVRRIVFRVEGGAPRFDPGSHINVRVTMGEGGVTRTYTAIPAGPGQLAVAVKRHGHSRGGSRFMWQLAAGDTVDLTLPENRFELSWRAPRYLLIAGGIGITPIYGMTRALAQRGADFRLAYGGRTRAAMPFADELAAIGERVELFAGDEGKRIDVAAEIAALPPGGELYACGPIKMLDAIRAAWRTAGRAPGRLRFEVFGDSGAFAEVPFEVEVAGRGIAVRVRADQTMLEALLGAGVDMIYDCQRGECGLCAVDVLDADRPIDHRDVFLSPEERAQGRRLCSCVSRFTGGRARIDIGYRA